MIDREDRGDIARLVARAQTQAERMLLVALYHLETRPTLRARVDVDALVIDIVVELGGRRLAVLLGRAGDDRTEADRERDAALERAGWAVYRLPPARVLTKPLRAVGDVLAALHERGKEVAPPVRARRKAASPAPVGALRELVVSLGKQVV